MAAKVLCEWAGSVEINEVNGRTQELHDPAICREELGGRQAGHGYIHVGPRAGCTGGT